MSSVTDGSVAPETHESPAMEPQPLALLPLQPSHQTQHKDFPPQRSPSEAHLHGLVTRHDSALLRRRPIKICVLGSGSFATAMGTHLARQGHEIFLLTRRPDVAASIKSTHHNPSVFATYALPFNLTATTDASIALSGADYVLHAIPVQASFEYLAALADVIPPGLPIINTSKGLHTQRLQLMTELIPQALGRSQPVAVISGPTFAEEIMKGYPTGAVAASADPALAIAVAKLFSCHTFRIFTSSDVVGVEVAGALKNVYALCAGCLAGLGLGVNTTALLVTRACAEMSRLARELGSEEATLAGLSGVGDLMLTCFGNASRNRSVGERIGRGEAVADVIASLTEAAEGVATAPAALALARRHGVSVPIIEAVVAVLQGIATPMSALMALLSVEAREE